MIAETVIRRGSMSIEKLMDLTGVSLMTVYRDIAALEEAGLVHRERGVISATASSLQEASAEFRMEQNVGAKSAIARVVVDLVRPGNAIMLDDSTSGVYVLRALADVRPLTVVTNSLLVAQEVELDGSISLFMTGGEYQPWARALMGAKAVRFLESVRADVCIMSASGLSGDACLHPYQDVADVKRAMLKQSRTRVLVIDHSKSQRSALHSFAVLSDFDHVVVDSETSAADVQRYRDAGCNVLIAQVG